MLGFSTSAYYAWLKTKEERDKKQKDYETAIAKIFTESNNTYGPDRICGLLRRQGYTASYKRVSTIMKKLGLSSVHNRRRQRSLTDSRNARGKDWPNLVRKLSDIKPLQVITSDISYIRTAEGFE
ncbi:MAG: IS3 family transposase [Bacteroidales bacterium]|nr:IS3 family transposase [Bacteroidales bacterium]